MRATARRTASVLAGAAVISCVSLIAFFTVGGPFGTINDAGNGVLALLCALLAATLHRRGRSAATTLAIAGAATAVFGSFLVMTDSTGYFFAGLVSALGFALVGLWLQGLDDPGAAPTWLLAAGICWAGTYVCLPLWAFRFATAWPRVAR